ncbi:MULTISPECIES: ParM/StbA family protein [unclassified Clostridioides]|uniref:ParM/StbA family protein n=1 Tax=unclassified Clostridioides TaxID=2635829 RepID=UPI001D1212DA|nr:ParM/StbA family protein [Clostridioides sp. ZZV15-6597]MCC0669248.1 ParM/StbA family protein [Clostridioides sp. ZZV14-6153]MCC0726419.1 ParM/StbA family protein [Clostridioides sp. ZZV14-6045]MCC0731279.1 ParM/StbA family protein [Clostridioides sp. ZZV14-6048]MCC0735289.1 ParM/StbA family protein [Clostridioides sp. ZZV14-6009]MCC0739918.1 ParM/StbA family protein [Clostridioides sp. ZZV14-5902]
MEENYQVIGLDIGRGYVKGYSKYNGMVKECLFKSVFGDGRNIDFEKYENPIYIDFESVSYFVGSLAEKESITPIRNSDDSKVSFTMRILVAAALNEIAVADEVKLMMGVPYKSFRKTTLKEVVDTYKGKTFKVKDKIKGGHKEIKISDISIFREGDAALFHTLEGKVNEDKAVGMVSIGFRSTEMSFFEKGFVFNDKLSDTLEAGNQDALTMVQKQLKDRGIIRELNEIDSSNDYDELKKVAYIMASESTAQRIASKWKNIDEMDVYVSGGTALHMTFDNRFKVSKDAQMATAKGLFEVGMEQF